MLRAANIPQSSGHVRAAGWLPLSIIASFYVDCVNQPWALLIAAFCDLLLNKKGFITITYVTTSYTWYNGTGGCYTTNICTGIESSVNIPSLKWNNNQIFMNECVQHDFKMIFLQLRAWQKHQYCWGSSTGSIGTTKMLSGKTAAKMLVSTPQ